MSATIDDDVLHRPVRYEHGSPSPVTADFAARLAAGPRMCPSCDYLRLPSSRGACPDCGIPI